MAHGAELFAAATAVITFTTHFIDKAKAKGKLSIYIFLAISGLLFGLTFYIVIQLSYYGYLANATLEFVNPSSNYQSLSQYKKDVINFMENSGKDPLKQVILFLHNFWYKLIFSIILGIIIAIIIFLAFSNTIVKSQSFSSSSTMIFMKRLDRNIFFFFSI